MLPIILGTVLPWTVVGIGCWLMQRLVRRQAIILARFDGLDRQLKQIAAVAQRRQMKDNLTQFLFEQQSQALPAPVNGLPEGSAAPAFELPDLSGVTRQLNDFRGRQVLLIFFNPECGYCARMAPDLAALPLDNAHPLPVLIASGSAEAMLLASSEHFLRCPILFDTTGQVGSRYKMSGTPTGYQIDEQGIIASPLMVGAPELLSLAAETLPIPMAEAVADKPKVKGKVNRGLESSRINRAGLKAGAVAPEFRLPKVGGGELALEELRGQRVLLVISDPECGPCNAVAPKLEQLHQNSPAVKLVMISRRDEEANRKKIAELGLTFPVVLQRSWEISKLYGIFETPVGYLIDENGVILHDVAKGADAILALIEASTLAFAAPILSQAA